MKKIFLLLFFMISTSVFSQNVNDYEYVLVPLKFSQFSENDAYRLNTLTKMFLQKFGFKSYFPTDSIPNEIADSNCKKLFADLVKDKSMFTTKVKLVLKDCRENVVYETAFGSSKEKSYMAAYNEALREAFKSFDNLKYKYNGKNDVIAESAAVGVTTQNSETLKAEPAILKSENAEEFFFAQPIANGFQIVDTTPKVVMKLFKTSDSNVFIAVKGDKNGVLFSKSNQWIFECYENGKLVSETLKLKF